MIPTVHWHEDRLDRVYLKHCGLKYLNLTSTTYIHNQMTITSFFQTLGL